MSAYAIGRHKDKVPLNVIKQAESLGKHEHKFIEDNEHKFLLVGSSMAIEDYVDEAINTLFQSVSTIFTDSNSETCICDDAADIRDRLLYGWLNANDITLVYGNIEF